MTSAFCGRHLLSYLLALTATMSDGATLPFVLPWPQAVVPIRNSHPSAGNDLWNAIREVEAATPVRFVNWTGELDFVDVVMGDGDVVRNSGWVHNTSDVIGFCRGRSELSLKNTSGWLAMHELGHVLGLVHEHQRADRDQYVEVLWGNISDPEPHDVNWVKISHSDLQGLSYDPNSVMHYGSDWQGKEDGLRTLSWLSNPAAAGSCIHYDCAPVVGWSHLTANDIKAISAIHSNEATRRDNGDAHFV